MMTRAPTEAEIAEALSEAEAAQAARQAALAKAAASEPPRPDFSGPRPLDFVGERHRLTDGQVQELIGAYRASYSHYSPEIAALMEEKLTVALKADGIGVPPQPLDDRL